MHFSTSQYIKSAHTHHKSSQHITLHPSPFHHITLAHRHRNFNTYFTNWHTSKYINASHRVAWNYITSHLFRTPFQTCMHTYRTLNNITTNYIARHDITYFHHIHTYRHTWISLHYFTYIHTWHIYMHSIALHVITLSAQRHRKDTYS